MTSFRRFLAGCLLLWSVFSLSISPDLVHQAMADDSSTQQNALITMLPLPGNYPGVNIVPYAEGKTGSQGVVAALNGIFKQAKQLLAPILVFFIGFFGIRLIVAGGQEEEFNKASKHFLYLLIGTAFVIFANFLSDTFLLYQTPTGGEATTFVSGSAQIIGSTQRIKDQLGFVITFLRYVLGGIAVFYVVKSGATLIVNADEETATKQKEVFIYGFVGFLLIMISETLVRTVFDINPTGGVFNAFIQAAPVDLGVPFTPAQVNVSGGLSLLTNVTNLFLAGLSGLFLFSLVAGGALYAFSAGNEERGQKATKVIIGSLIGLVIAFSSYTLVAEFASGGREVAEVEAPTGVKPLVPLPPPATPPVTPPVTLTDPI